MPAMKNVVKDQVGNVVQDFVDGDYDTITVTANGDGTYDITAD